MAAAARTATEADLLQTPRDGYKYELVDGEIRVSPAGSRHGAVCLALGARILAHVRQRSLGHVFDSSTGFRMPGGNVRSPDVGFVARGRLEGERAPDGFCPVPPDLAIEVLSPEDRTRAVLDKVGEYLQAGVSEVWVIDPRRRAAVLHRSLTDVRSIGSDDALEGAILPGFSCRLAEILD